MPKYACELENPMALPFSFSSGRMKLCSCGCGAEIDPGFDSHIIIDNWAFAEDSCVTDFFINECGGHRVYL
ncbi:hypothetical protein ABEV00_22065 [Paenibacillus thiaminolyticus]|uniref:hypothetical protein n=1 Tax=Paenibacillus thiaminolyticus TaxID=49283 RepID=UPI003D2ACF92